MRQLLKDRITVTRPPDPVQRDASAGKTGDYDTVYTNVPASVQAVSAQDTFFWYQANIKISHTIYVRQALTLLNGDIIEANGETFYYSGIRNLRRAGYAIDCFRFSN